MVGVSFVGFDFFVVISLDLCGLRLFLFLVRVFLICC